MLPRLFARPRTFHGFRGPLIRWMAAWALALTLVMGCACAASPYAIEVDITNQIVTVYRAEDPSETGIVRQMICSTGTNECTPVGRFALNQRNSAERGEWYAIPNYNCYVQYVTRIVDSYLFHSLPYAEKDVSTLDPEAAALLGTPASHGCIRLRPEDAKWIAKNCPNGTACHIYHSRKPDEGLRGLLLVQSYAEGGGWENYADFARGAGGLTSAVQSMVTKKRIEGVVAEVTPTPGPEN